MTEFEIEPCRCGNLNPRIGIEDGDFNPFVSCAKCGRHGPKITVNDRNQLKQASIEAINQWNLDRKRL